MELTPANTYDELLRQIGTTLETGRAQAIQAVYAHNLETYWRVGRHIVEFEQGGKAKARCRLASRSHAPRGNAVLDALRRLCHQSDAAVLPRLLKRPDAVWPFRLLPTLGTLTKLLPSIADDAERRRRHSHAERGNEWNREERRRELELTLTEVEE